MSQQVGQRAPDGTPGGGPRTRERTVSERGTGGALFAATLMIIGGCFGIFQGIALIARGTFYVQPANYWISTNAATWGWVHLFIGLLVLAAGFGVISGAAWARWLGIIMVSVQALLNFLYIPAQPWWSITLILVDLWIIHSLFVHRREYV
jgi:hypothetical protein